MIWVLNACAVLLTSDTVGRSIQPKVVVLHDYPHGYRPYRHSLALEDNAKVIGGVVVSLGADVISPQALSPRSYERDDAALASHDCNPLCTCSRVYTG
jgi:hypothetical protein